MTEQHQGSAAFDLIGEPYEEVFSQRQHQVAAGEWLIRRLPSGARVVDLGCGSGGPTARQFVDAGLSVVGIDESERMVELARHRVPEAQFVHGDLRDFGAELGEFDAAVAFLSLLMLSRAEIASLLRRVRGALRGPRLLVLSMVYGDLDAKLIQFMGVPVRVTAYPLDALGGEVRDAGFVIEDMREVSVPAEPGRTETWLFVFASAAGDDA